MLSNALTSTRTSQVLRQLLHQCVGNTNVSMIHFGFNVWMKTIFGFEFFFFIDWNSWNEWRLYASRIQRKAKCRFWNASRNPSSARSSRFAIFYRFLDLLLQNSKSRYSAWKGTKVGQERIDILSAVSDFFRPAPAKHYQMIDNSRWSTLIWLSARRRQSMATFRTGEDSMKVFLLLVSKWRISLHFFWSIRSHVCLALLLKQKKSLKVFWLAQI